MVKIQITIIISLETISHILNVPKNPQKNVMVLIHMIIIPGVENNHLFK